MYTREIKRISSEILKKIISIRREIHQFPELGFKEYRTSSLISEELNTLGFKVSSDIAGTGVTGLLEGSAPGKTIAVRADMDALPITEENNVEYASKNKGIMHACGHDAHVSIALGTAHILSRLKDRIKGNVKFIFQPAEEGLGGAKALIDKGVLNSPKVDAIIALHMSPGLKSGQVSISSGPVMASPSEFEIVINGNGGHAAKPHEAVDPIIIGTNIINLFQAIVSRNVSPVKSAVLSVTCFQAGNAYNVIPSKAVIKGTVRTFEPLLDREISQRMLAIVSSVCGSMGAEYSFDYNQGYPPVINDQQIVNMIIESSSKVIDHKAIKLDEQISMLAEDFSYYLNHVPGALFNLGCTGQSCSSFENLHSSRFDIDEGCMATGMEILAQCVLDYLQG